MAITAAALTIGLLLQALTSTNAEGPAFILRCQMGDSRPGWAGAEVWRTFRLGPNSFQEWKADEHKFGPNLCGAFACSADKNRLQGTIGSSTLVVTIELTPERRQGSWSASGASGLNRTSGPCLVQSPTAPIEPE